MAAGKFDEHPDEHLASLELIHYLGRGGGGNILTPGRSCCEANMLTPELANRPTFHAGI